MEYRGRAPLLIAFKQNLDLSVGQQDKSLSRIWLEINSIEKELVPHAEKNTELMRMGYRKGRFSLLEVLMSEDEKLEFQNRLLALKKEYRMIELEWQSYMTAGSDKQQGIFK